MNALARLPLRRSQGLRAALAVAGLLAAAGPASAGIGQGTSPPALVDTALPVVVLDDVPANLLLQGGQGITFHWTTADDHPGTQPTDFVAEVRAGQDPVDAIDYLSTWSETTWHYVVPEISSGLVHAVVTCRDAFGNTTTVRTGDFSVILSTSDVPAGALPGAPRLEGNLPNPCNPGTTVRFSLPGEGYAVLDLYAANGARVRRLAAGSFGAGRHEVFWDGCDDRGQAVASGTYLLRLAAGNTVQTGKLALVR